MDYANDRSSASDSMDFLNSISSHSLTDEYHSRESGNIRSLWFGLLFGSLRTVRTSAFSGMTIWSVLLPCIILLAHSLLLAQNISGVINTYVHVIGIDTCLNTATVASEAGFAVGDRVLVIQMQGATIDTSNSATYGTVLSLGSAGLYEVATIDSFPDLTTIRFQNKLLNAYDPQNAAVQIVRIPQFTDVTVVDTLRPLPWDPASGTGGVLALEASGTLTLKAQVDASNCGFWGGPGRRIGLMIQCWIIFSTDFRETAATKGMGFFLKMLQIRIMRMPDVVRRQMAGGVVMPKIQAVVEEPMVARAGGVAIKPTRRNMACLRMGANPEKR